MNVAALRLAHDADAHSHDVDIAAIGERGSRLGVEIADLVGLIEDVGALGRQQMQTLRDVVRSAQSSGETNAQLAASMQEVGTSASQTRSLLASSADTVAGTLDGAVTNMRALSDGVMEFSETLSKVSETIKLVRDVSASINEIARETQLVAINASIEAARLGDAGKGFAVIGSALKALADQVGNAAKRNEASLAALQDTLGELTQSAHSSAHTAEEAITASARATEATRTIQSLVQSVEELADNIDLMAEPVRRNIEASDEVRGHLRSMVTAVKASDAKLAAADERSHAILDISEDFILFIAGSGIETPDTPLIEICKYRAGEVSALFEEAIDRGRISMADLFDEGYRPVLGTNPEQFLARFTSFTDAVLPSIQEPVLQMDERIAFCAAIDRNGYLPTHNLIYSKPQGNDPVWNMANCRNHRMFRDRTGLGAGQNTRPFLLQTYRRDMGGGEFVLMKDVSAPIMVKGRHWGGFRIGYRV
ncbi:methyl-accepting chemotaxis protein [Aquamicrobium zhengzhouense]|uniref:Methyl-accepting chemotaxis protein n=1 Tax=Aquamicrobium zhengzhouense TaxID=2781738 RepID=A0ABS0SCJ0_9HYPH|nr:methyl-accepting chemotaxis protein [Aquamicrobium zhengzhouense]MBI1620956.1 methyl-accepting chemotaxis protein [Aquamicrobium zhengzhouense]